MLLRSKEASGFPFRRSDPDIFRGGFIHEVICLSPLLRCWRQANTSRFYRARDTVAMHISGRSRNGRSPVDSTDSN